MAITGAIVATVGTAYSIDQGKKAARAQKRQLVAKRANEFAERARQRREQIRERRIKTANLEAAAEASGVSGSSGAIGAAAALSTDFATNSAFGAGQQAARTAIGNEQVNIANAQLNQQIGGAVASTGMNIFSTEGGFKSIFSTGEE